MYTNHCVFIVFALLCTTFLTAWPARADDTIRCESRNYRYQYCRARTDNRVSLVRQRSQTRCRLNDNWGYDRNGVWVDRGCSADFKVGRGGNNKNKDKNAVIAAGAAIAGIALIAALASQSDSHGNDVSSWAVGTFNGYDEVERADVQITVLPGGSVRGYAGGHQFTGTLDGQRLALGRYSFRVERSGNGFVATDERDSYHRVMFRRVGSGY